MLKANRIALDRLMLDGTAPSVGHTVLDLGDDAFTVGKPHPMIEPSSSHCCDFAGCRNRIWLP